MHVAITASVLISCLVCQATCQTEASAKDLSPRGTTVNLQDSACNHKLDESILKANVSWEPPRTRSRPLRAYVVHLLTPSGADIKIGVNAIITRHEVNLYCWSAYVVRVEAIFDSGESAFSDALYFSTGNEGSESWPHQLSAVEDGTACKDGASTTSIKLMWKPVEVDFFNVTGYTITVTPKEYSHKMFRLGKHDSSFKYDNVSCEGNTFFSVHARALISFGLLDATPSEISLPDSYAYFSANTKAYVIPARTTTTARTTAAQSDTTGTASPSADSGHHSTTTEIITTEQTPEATTKVSDVEPTATGLSTSNILCIVLIPLAVILLALLLFFGYKKYKQAGGEGLLSTADSP